MAPRPRRLLICSLLLVVGVPPPVVPLPTAAAWRAGPALAAGATTGAATRSVPVPGAAATRSADDAINRVVAVSVDGLNPRAIRRLGPKGTPTFHRLMRQGASTLNARTVREQTRTLPNHTSMFTGRRVDERRRGHGVDVNRDDGRTVHRAAGRYVASVFDVVHDRGGRTALLTTKSKFAFYQRTWNAAGAADRVGTNQGRAKIDRFLVDTDDARLVARLTSHLRTNPGQFTFLHISLPDEVGHRHGFMGKRYLAAVQRADRLLGSVLSTIVARPTLRRETLVLVTADHGGTGRSHSNPGRLQNYRVPFLAWGPGVAAGRNLYHLNPARRSPGDRRTAYTGRQPIRNGDLANLVTDVLDLPKVPGSEFNANHELTLFR